MNRELVAGLVWGGSSLALAVGAVVARKLGWIADETVLRLVLGYNGVMIAWYGNRVPKKVVRSVQARRATRVSGWSMVVSGTIHAGLWTFASIHTAVVGGTLAVFIGVAVTLGYCLSLGDRAKSG